MKHGHQLKKRNERREMLRLMQERDKRTPERPEPHWVIEFWTNISRKQVLT